jgi:hypothetical protein
MNTISCGHCGVVLDLKRIIEPKIRDDDGVVDINIAAWDGDTHIATISCPVCKRRIFYEDGDKI